MPEKPSYQRGQEKTMARSEIEQGLVDYLAEAQPKKEISKDLAKTFNVTMAEDPITPEEFSQQVKDYIDQNFEKLLPLLVTYDRKLILEELKNFNITNEDLGQFGSTLKIVSIPTGIEITEKDKWDGRYRRTSIGSAQLLSYIYTKDMIRVDSQNEAGRLDVGIPHRYYHQDKKRYLCRNDYGMQVWSDTHNRKIEGNATMVDPFINEARAEFARVYNNIKPIAQGINVRNVRELRKKVFMEKGRKLTKKEKDEIKKQARIQTVEEIKEMLAPGSKNRELILEAIPAEKTFGKIQLSANRISSRYGFFSKDPRRDYENFIKFGHKRLSRLFRQPKAQEKEGATIDFVLSDIDKKPIIVEEDRVQRAQKHIHSVVEANLLNRAVQTEKDTNLLKVYIRYRSPYEMSPDNENYFRNHDLYKLIKRFGPKKVEQIFTNAKLPTAAVMRGFEYLKAMKYNISRLNAQAIAKQIFEVHKLTQSGLWNYLMLRDVKYKGVSNVFSWLKSLGTRRAIEVFNEGKRIFWLGSQCHYEMHRQAENQPYQMRRGRAFIQESEHVNWGIYDLSDVKIPQKKINQIFNQHKNQIVNLLSTGPIMTDQYTTLHPDYAADQQKRMETGANLSLVIQAIATGHDLRGAALATDKKRYLEGVIHRENEDDVEFALKDWSPAHRRELDDQTLRIYYENAEEFMGLDPRGLENFISWKMQEKSSTDVKDKAWIEMITQAAKTKDNLDFMICLSRQVPEVRNWYRDGAEYVGSEVIEEYLMKFNATRDQHGKFANWHDTLFWVPNISKLNKKDAKGVLLSIQTMDANQAFVQLLPRYDKERDPLKASGPIESLRELKKRVIAIEANIDYEGLPDEVIEITFAPGFNVAHLANLRQDEKFERLIAGELDKEQPFKPHKRTFCSRPLSEAISEGLGSRKKKIKGLAQSPKKLFAELNKLVKGREIDGKRLKVLDLLENVPIELEEDIIKLLQKQRVNTGPIVEAEIHAKSDPQGWVCGNYTDCCMPFGAYNNTDYMFNKSTQYFTVKYNGRIISQSVIVDSQDKRDNSDVVILDNIEVAHNYKNLNAMLSKVYKTFWSEYTSKPVKVGAGYLDLIPSGAKLEENNFIHKTRLHYSDSRGPKVYDMPKLRGVESIDQIVSFANLSERDADMVAKIEKETYPAGMTLGKARIAETLRRQRELEVPGAAGSFVIRKGDEPAGYLLLLPEDSKIKRGEQVAHVHDMAILPKFQGQGLAKEMLEHLLEVALIYKVSIEAEARASTSYAMVMNESVRRWMESKGFYLVKNEKIPKYLGNEDFYFIRLENRQEVQAEAA